MEDWREKLGAAFGVTPATDAPSPAEPEKPAERGDALAQQRRAPVHIVYERKGRGGKQATIVTDLVADDDAIAELATTLKRRLATGGSSRGGEILLQGDVRERVRALLVELGFNVK